jgi:hypothetical protein
MTPYPITVSVMLQLSLEAVQVRILKRCEGLLSRSSWPVLLVYVDSADVAHFGKHGELVAWPWAATIAQRTRLGLHRVNYAKAELQAVRVLVKLRHSYVGQPAVYKVDPDFTPSADYLHLLEGVPLAAPLERDAEHGLALRGEGTMMNELGAKWR